MLKGTVSLDEVLGSLPEERRAKIEARGSELLAGIQQRMTLAQARKSRKMTQTDMANSLGVGQMQISRLEKRGDMRLSSIQKSVEAMGGKLYLVATFPGETPVLLVTEEQ